MRDAQEERYVNLLDRVYKAWSREGWEEGGEDIAEVLGDVAWELYDRTDAPLTKIHRATDGSIVNTDSA